VPNPIEASIQITERCNSRCVTCDFWKRKSGSEATTKELENVFHQLKEVGIKIIGFTGGEPLLRNDIGQLIEKAKKITGARTYIITNGLLLPEKASLLVKSGIDYVSISLDGLEVTDRKIRGVSDHYEKVMKGIKALRSLKNDLPINIGTTLVRDNLSEIPKLVELCKKINTTWSYNLLDTNLYFFKNINTSPLLANNNELVDRTFDYLHKANKETPEIVSTPPLCLEFARNYLKNKKTNFHCSIGYLRVFISPVLDIYSGCWVLPPLGNLKKENIKTIIRSTEYKERLEKMFNLKCPGCTCGYAISLVIGHPLSVIFQSIRNLGKHKKYLLMMKRSSS
jgi:MoaA/NifB/PqqE/SkfB family radical SAM enzyme